jgi:hypothetical protein
MVKESKEKLMCDFLYLWINDSDLKETYFTTYNSPRLFKNTDDTKKDISILNNIKERDISNFYTNYISERPSSISGSRLFIQRKELIPYLDKMVELKYLKKKKHYTTFRYKRLDIGKDKINEMRKEIILAKLKEG